MRIEHDLKLGFKDVMFRPKRSKITSRSHVTLKRQFRFLHSAQTWEGMPLIAANMDQVGTFSMARALAEHHIITAIHKHYRLDAWQDFINQHTNTSVFDYLMVSSGTSEQDFEQLQAILNLSKALRFICLDVANGYSEHFVHFVRKVRDTYPEHVIVAGNVVTGEMVEELLLSGADVIKVGIGPGSVCTTRVKTGVGYPQLSAIIECADAAHGLGGLIIGDGGCTCPGDIAKAFGGGADFVMLGGMFAGHEECGGDIINKDGKNWMRFYGMSSEAAMAKHVGRVAEYRASEGKEILLPYKGQVAQTLQDILGGLRSTCTYIGASTLKELSKRTTFIRVAEQENTVFNRT